MPNDLHVTHVSVCEKWECSTWNVHLQRWQLSFRSDLWRERVDVEWIYIAVGRWANDVGECVCSEVGRYRTPILVDGRDDACCTVRLRHSGTTATMTSPVDRPTPVHAGAVNNSDVWSFMPLSRRLHRSSTLNTRRFIILIASPRYQLYFTAYEVQKLTSRTETK